MALCSCVYTVTLGWQNDSVKDEFDKFEFSELLEKSDFKTSKADTIEI